MTRSSRTFGHTAPHETYAHDEVQRRIMRAIITLRCQRLPERSRPRGYGPAWARPLQEGALAVEAALRHGRQARQMLDLPEDIYRRVRNFRVDDYADFELVAAVEDDTGWQPPFTPTMQDLDEYLVALGWWSGLARLPSKPAPRQRRVSDGDLPLDTDQKIIWWVASAYTFEQIGRQIDAHGATAQRRYRAAMRDCWRIANGWARLRDSAA